MTRKTSSSPASDNADRDARDSLRTRRSVAAELANPGREDLVQWGRRKRRTVLAYDTRNSKLLSSLSPEAMRQFYEQLAALILRSLEVWHLEPEICDFQGDGGFLVGEPNEFERYSHLARDVVSQFPSILGAALARYVDFGLVAAVGTGTTDLGVCGGSHLFLGTVVHDVAELVKGMKPYELATQVDRDRHDAGTRLAPSGRGFAIYRVQTRTVESQVSGEIEQFSYVVHLEPHDPRWFTQADLEIQQIRDALGAELLNIEQMGSTAVPGVRAKPTIDLIMSTRHTTNPMFGLPELGYAEVDLATSALAFRRMFRRTDAEGRPLVNLHVVSAEYWGDARERRFRDLLLQEPAAAQAYSAAKEYLAKRTNCDPRTYGARKGRFIGWLEVDYYGEMGTDG